MSPRRVRLDAELVSQGFFRTTEDALRAVMAGDVSTSDRRLERPGEQVLPGIELHVRGQLPYVSRGGLKLERGLAAYGVDPSGLSCLDVGCSTGGFTDCLLQHGAARVLAVDVGFAQFDWSLRNDARVELLERTRMEDLAGTGREGSVDLAVCDVSFTSVERVLPAVCELLHEGGGFLSLIKPQFEAPREQVGEGGVVSSARVREAVVAKLSAAFERAGFVLVAPVDAYPAAYGTAVESPIHGAKGNVEYLLYGILS